MIRVCIFGPNAYGFDVTGWENKFSEEDYDNLLTEDLIEIVSQGDILMYFDSNESAEDWCEDNKYNYELVKSNDNN